MEDFMLQFALDRFLADRLYNPCCLLVHHDTATLEQVSGTIASANRWPLLSLDSTLSQPLLDAAGRRHGLEARELMIQKTQRYAPGPLLCVDIDVLFEPQLDLDPLALLKEMSRMAVLVVAWPGSIADGILTYAAPEHAHHRVWRQPDLCADCVLTV